MYFIYSKDMREGFTAAAPLEDRLFAAARTYKDVKQYLGVGYEDSDALMARIDALTQAEREEVADIYQGQLDALKTIALPPAYTALLDDIHKGVARDFAAQYEGKNIAAFLFEERVEFMQFIADAQARQWRQRFPEVMKDYPDTEVVPFQWDEKSEKYQDEFSLRRKQDRSGFYYRVSDKHSRDILGIAHCAAHEPEHSVQNHLCDLLYKGMELPEPLKEAATLFNFLRQHGANGFPNGFWYKGTGEPCDRVGKLAYQCYLHVPRETAGFRQGTSMEAEVARLFPALRPQDWQPGMP